MRTLKTRHARALAVSVDRYGDSVDPDADIAAMRSMRSFLKPDGVALLAVPVLAAPLRLTVADCDAVAGGR